MKRKARNILTFLGCTLWLLLLTSCGTERRHNFAADGKVMQGDDPAWAAKDYADSTWNYWWKEKIPSDKIYWIRLYVDFAEEEAKDKNTGVMVIATAAYEAYWDGVKIGKNGTLQTEDTPEVPGTYHGFFPLPDTLLGFGEHVLALRCTKADTVLHGHAFALTDNYERLLRDPLHISMVMFLLAGIFIITGVYFFFLFLSGPREYSALIFSIICFVFCGILFMEYLKLFYLYAYPFQRTRMEIIGLGHLLLTFLVPLFLMKQFKFPYLKIMLAVMSVVVLIFELNYHSDFDWMAKMHNKLMWLFSFIIIIYACSFKKQNAYTVMAGFLCSFAVIWILPKFNVPFVSAFDISEFLAFVFIILSMLYAMTMRRREERLAYEASLVLSERLKNELLKKNIKPHFIMNTLTSLMDWVEESPKEGVKFIGALADEFETLNEIADHKLVPVEQEIKLCKNHLEIMSYRKEINYRWEQKGIDPNEIIPPAVIHTAVENGVTHSLPDENGDITFCLIFQKTEKNKTYTLQTVAGNRPDADGENQTVGTGLKYIRARLEESYPGKWGLISRPTKTGWETVILVGS